MATSTISKHIVDIIRVDGPESNKKSLSNATSADFADVMVPATIPDGYKAFLVYYESIGHGRCLPTNFGSTWIANFSGSPQQISIRQHVVCVKFG